MSELLTECILTFYEDELLCRILRYNYFYFDQEEQKSILAVIHSLLLEQETYWTRDAFVWPEVLKYILEHKSIVLHGFVNFRLQSYSQLLDQLVDEAVSKYIIEKEYSDFIHL